MQCSRGREGREGERSCYGVQGYRGLGVTAGWGSGKKCALFFPVVGSHGHFRP